MLALRLIGLKATPLKLRTVSAHNVMCVCVYTWIIENFLQLIPGLYYLSPGKPHLGPL